MPSVAPLFVGLPLAVFGLSLSRTLPISAFFLGLLYVLSSAESRMNAALPDHLQDKSLQVVGQVSSLPERKDGIERFRFQVESIAECHSCWTGLTAISWYHAPVRVQPGDRLHLKVRLSKPSASLNPGLFDYEGWLFAHGIAASGYVSDARGFKLLESGVASFKLTESE